MIGEDTPVQWYQVPVLRCFSELRGIVDEGGGGGGGGQSGAFQRAGSEGWRRGRMREREREVVVALVEPMEDGE